MNRNEEIERQINAPTFGGGGGRAARRAAAAEAVEATGVITFHGNVVKPSLCCHTSKKLKHPH